MSRIFGLDLLRAIAISLVLVSHLWPTSYAGGWSGASGVMGVELFFVLSGFLIGGMLIRLADQGRLASFPGVLEFWRRRWYRTLPNYYLFLALNLAWGSWVLGYPDMLSNNWEYLIFLQNFRGNPPCFFTESWSLTIEEWFYLLFPLILWLAMCSLGRRPWVWLGVIAMFLLVPNYLKASFCLHYQLGTEDLDLRRWTLSLALGRPVVFRLDALMYGVLAAWLSVRFPERWRKLGVKLWPLGLALAGIGACGLALNWPFDRAFPFHGMLLAPCVSGGFAFLLPACSLMADKNGYVPQAVKFTAKISYSLYLCHLLIREMIHYFCGPRSSLPLVQHTLPWSLVGGTISVLVAWAVYRWYEKPMMDLRDHRKPIKFSRKQRLAASPPPEVEQTR